VWSGRLRCSKNEKKENEETLAFKETTRERHEQECSTRGEMKEKGFIHPPLQDDHKNGSESGGVADEMGD